MLDDSDQTVNSLLIEMAWFNLENTFKRKENLDNKANFILVATGVLLGVHFLNYGKLPPVFIAIMSTGLIITAILAVMVLRIKEYPLMGVMETWRALKQEGLLNNPKKAEERIFASLDQIIVKNITIIEESAQFYKLAFISFLISLFLLMGGILFSIGFPYFCQF